MKSKRKLHSEQVMLAADETRRSGPPFFYQRANGIFVLLLAACQLAGLAYLVVLCFTVKFSLMLTTICFVFVSTYFAWLLSISLRIEDDRLTVVTGINSVHQVQIVDIKSVSVRPGGGMIILTYGTPPQRIQVNHSAWFQYGDVAAFLKILSSLNERIEIDEYFTRLIEMHS